ncbi:hypothetical protein F4801DRAFT_604461 [Xylaria longipes]|nr:hypothetical protein F4801DRAFT_604461 [Xylaria longipes]
MMIHCPLTPNVVDDDGVPDSDAERVDVSVPELGCEFVDVDDVLEVDVAPEPDGRVFVPESVEVDDDVTDPDPDVGVVTPELVSDTSVDTLRVLDGPVLVVVVFPGTPGVQLDVMTVVLELEKVTEADVVVEVPGFVAFALVELRVMDIVVVMAAPFTSVPVTVVRIPELEDVSLAVVEPEFVAVLSSPGPGGLPREVVVEIVCVTPVLGLTAELLVIGALALSEIVDELPLFVCLVEVELDEPLLALLEVVVDVDGADPVALPEGTENVSEMIDVVVPETGPLEVGDVVSILEEPFDEEGVDTPEVCVPEFGGPDELVAVPLAPVAEEEVMVVGSVMTESVHEGENTDEDELLEVEFCVVKKMVDVISQTGIVRPEIVVILAVLLVPIVALLTVDPEEWLEDVDHDEPDQPEEPVDAPGMLLGGGSVNPG